MWKKVRKTVVVVGLLAVAPPLSLITQGDAAKGKRIYEASNCGTCHRGRGVGAIGPDLADPFRQERDREWLRAYLRDPRSLIKESTAPPLILPEQDLDDLVAYVQSLRGITPGRPLGMEPLRLGPTPPPLTLFPTQPPRRKR